MPSVSHVRRALSSLVVAVASTATLLATAPTASAAEATSAPVPRNRAHVAKHHTVGESKSAPKPKGTRALRALSIARAQTGDPYRYGSAGPSAFDCSGLVYYATHKAGLSGVPRTAAAQSGYARRISRSAMKPGDLVFFNDGGGVYHVGFYVGSSGGRRYILHAPRTGTQVRREAIWTDSWFPGTLRGR